MKIRYRCLLLMALGTFSASTLAGEISRGPQLSLSFSASFGGTTGSSYAVQFGSAASFPDELDSLHPKIRIPTSGISISSEHGLTPLILGSALLPRQRRLVADEEEGGIYWGWVAAGLAVAAGIAAASSGGSGDDDDDGGGGGGGTCIGDGDVIGPRPPPSVDPEACGL